MTSTQTDLVTIGKIERPFGVKGEVKVRSLSDVPGRFEHLDQVSLLSTTGRLIEGRVTHVRRAGISYIVRLAGVSTPEEAGLLRGALIQIPHEESSSRPGDTLYECDLIGMTVVDEAGQDLGMIETILEMPAQQVFVVRKGDRELLIPAVKHFVEAVDLKRRQMIVRAIGELVEESHAL
ncbi:ribosome maturation factor RimM [Petrachloros mirabilis]